MVGEFSVRSRAAERVAELLVALSGGPGTLSELSRRTGLAKTTTLRLLDSLAYQEAIVRDPITEHYRLLTEDLGSPLAVGRQMMESVRPELERLWEESGETVAVYAREGVERLCVFEIASTQPIAYRASVGSRALLSGGSAGKVLLAALAPDRLEYILDLIPFGRGAAKKRATLAAEVEATRDRGWAHSEGERIKGLSAVSVPIALAADMALSLSVLGPQERLLEDRRVGLVSKMQDRATAVVEQFQAAGVPELVAAG